MSLTDLQTQALVLLPYLVDVVNNDDEDSKRKIQCEQSLNFASYYRENVFTRPEKSTEKDIKTFINLVAFVRNSYELPFLGKLEHIN